MITAIVWRFSTVTGKTNGSGNAEIKHQECESIADRPAVRLPLSSPAPCLPAPWPPPTSSAPSSDPTPWPEEAPCDASRDSRSALVPSSGVDSRGHGSAYRKSQAAEALSQMSPDTERNPTGRNPLSVSYNCATWSYAPFFAMWDERNEWEINHFRDFFRWVLWPEVTFGTTQGWFPSQRSHSKSKKKAFKPRWLST